MGGLELLDTGFQASVDFVVEVTLHVDLRHQFGVITVEIANQGLLEATHFGDFESGLHAHFANTAGELMNNVGSTGDWNDDIEAQFKKGIEDFKATGSW